jgi:hypothetical protein
VRFSALFNPMMRQITGELGNVRDAARPRANGWAGRTRPVEQTILECARSLIESRRCDLTLGSDPRPPLVAGWSSQ